MGAVRPPNAAKATRPNLVPTIETYLLIGRLDCSGGTEHAVDWVLHCYTLLVTINESRWIYDIRLRSFER